MNTKILVSLLVIGITAIAVGGAMTGAFFSDTETSTGNTFTAGSIDLQVDSKCSYNGVSSATGCGVWSLKELAPTNDKFFNFNDLKPGDYGEDTATLQVTSNPAWACVTIKRTDDTGLGSNLNFMVWADTCSRVQDQEHTAATPGDNLYQDGCDKLLTQGPLSGIGAGQTWTLADSNTNNLDAIGSPIAPMAAGIPYHIGVAWCFGTVNSLGVCDGTPVTNEAQGKLYQADISFSVIQQRNNLQYICPAFPR